MSILRNCLLLLPIAVGCGCGPLASKSPVSYQINAVKLQTNMGAPRAHNDDSPLQFVGRNSCSATACHGQPHADPVSWRNAYPMWEAADPHRRAFDVLYAERSVQMFRKLTETTAASIDDAVYLRFVEEKCIGCHATPPAGSLTTTKLSHQTSPDVYWQGVSCESCHGPASNWLGQHYSLSWPNSADAGRPQLNTMGFQDTRSLDKRAAVCLKCHHGPQQIGEQLYDVNHDLIAAGHPRLEFELHAYLTNLPKHWDETAEVARYAAAEKAQSLHFDTWRMGAVQQFQQDARLKHERAKIATENKLGEWAEFANHDCRHCHHTVGETKFRVPFFAMTTEHPSFLSKAPPTTVADRSRSILSLIQLTRQGPTRAMFPSHEQAVEIYLGASAFAADLPPNTLTTELTQLQHAIGAQSGKSQYDLPGKFDPEQPALRQALTALEQALQQLAP